MRTMFVWFMAAVVLAGLAYVRLAPTDAARWHQPVEAQADKTLQGGAIRVLDADEDALARVDAAARALPRTQVLAGSVSEGRITYITRSKWVGFPDYTTVEQSGGRLRMYARLRFGSSDLGVNARRLERLVAAAKA